MKQLLIIKIQNISDVITNSSSEIFICKSDNAEQTIELLEEVLESVYENYKKAQDHAGSNTYGYYGETLSDILTISVAEDDYTDEWYGYKINKGDVLIESVTDNSIPGIIMDFIELFFKWNNVKRVHLG